MEERPADIEGKVWIYQKQGFQQETLEPSEVLAALYPRKR